MFFLHAPREHEASADIKVDSGRTNQSSLFLQLTVLITAGYPVSLHPSHLFVQDTQLRRRL